MLRDKSLIPLSHQHQHALALCVRLSRDADAGELDLEVWQAEIEQQFEQETSMHFAAEEKEVFPRAARFAEMEPLVEKLRAEHTALRELFARASDRRLDQAGLAGLGEKLTAHIRKEERQLFEAMQKHMSREELEQMGSALDQSLRHASRTCALPNQRVRRNQTEPD